MKYTFPRAEYLLNAVGSTFTTPSASDTAPDSSLTEKELVGRRHMYIGVTFTNSAGTPVTPTAGTYTVTAETWNNPGTFQAIAGGTAIDATATPITLSVSAPVTRVRVACSSIGTATHFDLRISAFPG